MEQKHITEPAEEAFYQLADYLKAEFGRDTLTERHLSREPESLIASFTYKGKKLGQIYYRKCKQIIDSYVSFEPNAEFTESLRPLFECFDTPDRPVNLSRKERQLRFTDYEKVKDSVTRICKHLKQIVDEA